MKKCFVIAYRPDRVLAHYKLFESQELAEKVIKRVGCEERMHVIESKWDVKISVQRGGLGVTLGGYPKHPVRLANDTQLEPYFAPFAPTRELGGPSDKD
jgi:hypothetical protein